MKNEGYCIQLYTSRGQGWSPVEVKLGSGPCLPADTLVRTITSLQVSWSKLKILNAAAAAIRHLVRLSLSAKLAVIQQCFSLITNQRTVFSATKASETNRLRVLQRQPRTKGCCAMHASGRQGLSTRHQQRTAYVEANARGARLALHWTRAA
jgi:hypothetical protein